MKSMPKRTYMKKFSAMMSAIVLTIIMCIPMVSFNTEADETDPCTIYGTVKDEKNIGITGAIITIENLNTKETNINGNDTITGSPIPVITDANGRYTFVLLNLKSGYSSGNEFLITAEKDGIIGSESIIVSEGAWGEGVDLTLGNKETQGKEEWYAQIEYPWILFFIIAIIITVILIAILLKRKKGSGPKTEQIEGTSMVGEGTNRETGVELDSQSTDEPSLEDAELIEVDVYECPVCGEESGAEDTECSICGIEFAKM